MASKVEAAMQNFQFRGSDRLRGGGRLEYQAVQHEAQEGSKLFETMGKFVQMGGDAFMKYDEHKRQKADERSDEIIRSLTPEQRRQATANGTLLYQDDKYAMEALKQKTGRNAAFLVDDDVAQQIKQGVFRTRQEMEQYRHTQMQKRMKEYADENGIDSTDEFFQKGFNSNITERNISLYGAHDMFLSDQHQKGALMNSQVELGSALTDPGVLRSPEGGKFFAGYIKNGLLTGSIPSDQQAHGLIMSSLSDVAQRDGGVDFLNSVENETVTLNGATSTVKDLMGQAQWDNLKVKAQTNQYQMNAKRTEEFDLTLNSAINQDDPSKGWEMLQKAKAQNDKVQPGEEMTPERQKLIAAERAIQDRVHRDTAARKTELVKAQQRVEKNTVIEDAYNKRLHGDYLSLNYKDMPTSEVTGEFSHSDMVNFANKKIQDINAMNLTQEQKDRMLMDYLRVDDKDGAFRTAYGTLVSDANSEWQGAVVRGELPENTPALDSLRRSYQMDKSLFAQLYPEQASLFQTMDMMDQVGIDPQTLLDRDAEAKAETKEMRFEKDRAWASLKNNSAEPALARIPTSLDATARTLYESYYRRTGDSDGAQEHVTKWLNENTVSFKGESDDRSMGTIPKNALMINSDPDSWKQGQAIIEQAAAGISKANPWITNEKLTIYERDNSIYLMSLDGTVRVRYDKDLMDRAYQEQQAKLSEKKADEAIKKASTRSVGTRLKARGDAKRKAAEEALQAKGGLYR